MAGYGRRQVPGEQGVEGVLNHNAVMNRTIRAQVTSVDPDNGFVTVSYESLPSGGRFATVNPLWMSFPDPAFGGPAWGRFMPQQTDVVKLSFDYNDRAHIVGYDIVANKPTVADGRSGWPQLAEQHEVSLDSEDPIKAKFAQFIPLNPGEFDFMSSGGAYIHANNRGRLYMAGGSVSIALNKNDLRMESRAQLYNHIADDCELRIGQVRRITDSIDKAVGDGLLKEFSVDLKNTTSAGNTVDLSKFVIGNIYDSDGEVLVSEFGGEDLRYIYQAFDDDGHQALKMSIDKIGNMEIVSFSEQSGLTMDFTNADWKATFKDINFEASSSMVFTTPLFHVDSPNIQLGKSATHPYILSNIYRPAEDVWFAAINTAVVAIVGAVSAFGTAAGVLNPILAPAAATMAGVLASAATAITSANTAFTNANSTYLSTIVKGQ